MLTNFCVPVLLIRYANYKDVEVYSPAVFDASIVFQNFTIDACCQYFCPLQALAVCLKVS